MKSLKTLFLLGSLATALLGNSAIANNGWEQVLRGQFENHEFTVGVNPKQTAALQWDDGYAGFYAYYSREASKEYRCPCDVYVNGPRRIIAEYSFDRPGFYQSVKFEKN
ncbi:MAG: hypothetical protein ACKOA8_17550 [Deltaproteobacteria bacterium]